MYTETQEFEAALNKLRQVASNFGISVAQAADSMRSLARQAEESTVMFGDSQKQKYATLNPKHEIL